MKQLTAASLGDFFAGGCAFLSANKEQVNALNVFPVPDGDTGTNMSLTMHSAIKDIAGKATATQVMASVSMGALMGARGNSGVILSQLFRGFAQGVGQKETLNAQDFAEALAKGVALAYKSVMKPVEGTVLTVGRMMSEAVTEKAQSCDDILEVLSYGIAKGEEALANTPNQLPVLKKAGVVDAGGQGLICIFTGGLKNLRGDTDLVLEPVSMKKETVKTDFSAQAQSSGDIKYGYCTEVLLKGRRLNPDQVRAYLSTLDGDSLLVVGDENVVKMHFHTNNPGALLSYVAQFGSMHDIKIDNMREQHHHLQDLEEIVQKEDLQPSENIAAQEEQKLANCGVVAVVSGDGLAQIFTDLGAGAIINGGQTMNPSTEDLVKAIESLPAKEVIILPNNSNIILTAKQAKLLTEKKVEVVECKFITQGLAAMLTFLQESSAAENMELMKDSFQGVKSGEITYAVRASSYDGFQIHENDILGLQEGQIKVVGEDIDTTMLDLLQNMVSDTDSLISVFYGKDYEEEKTTQLVEKLEARYPDLDIEIHYGGQPLYYLLVSVE